VTLYLIASNDNSLWTDGIDGDATGDQTTSLRLALTLDSMAADSDEIVLRPTFNLIGKIVGTGSPRAVPPPYFTLLVRNLSGAAFASTGHLGNFRLINALAEQI
jgi:hypothetical protein